eukprot:1185889-Prorocentrum_minimum.AAC.1
MENSSLRPETPHGGVARCKVFALREEVCADSWIPHGRTRFRVSTWHRATPPSGVWPQGRVLHTK